MCSYTSYICSCGTEFTKYKDMQDHSTTHEPGYQVLNHETIRKRRILKSLEEEKQLKRFQTGEVVWKPPMMNKVPPISSAVKNILQTRMPPVQSAQTSQVPQTYASVSQTSLLPNPVTSGTQMKNMFGDAGAPTVDLWSLYQPVVLLQTTEKFNKEKPYSCGKCGQCFLSKASLVSHYSSHVTDKVSGCIGCGLLLSSKKFVPRFHVCNLPKNTSKFKLVTAKPLNNKKLNETVTDKSWSQEARKPQATFSLQPKSLNSTAARKGSQTSFATSFLPFKSETVTTFSKSNHKHHITSSLQSNPSLCASTLYNNVPNPSNSLYQNHTASLNKSQGLSVTSGKLKPPTVAELIRLKSSGPNEFICRVCHCEFGSPQLLQRHKCAKAKEFMAQHVRGGRNYPQKRVTPPAQVNGERQLGMPASGNMKKEQVITVNLDEDQSVDMDDDCFIVESGPGKPAEVIYQVTSSVPIKT